MGPGPHSPSLLLPGTRLSSLLALFTLLLCNCHKNSERVLTAEASDKDKKARGEEMGSKKDGKQARENLDARFCC